MSTLRLLRKLVPGLYRRHHHPVTRIIPLGGPVHPGTGKLASIMQFYLKPYQPFSLAVVLGALRHGRRLVPMNLLAIEEARVRPTMGALLRLTEATATRTALLLGALIETMGKNPCFAIQQEPKHQQ